MPSRAADYLGMTSDCFYVIMVMVVMAYQDDIRLYVRKIVAHLLIKWIGKDRDSFNALKIKAGMPEPVDLHNYL
jgi:hypothetical protein